MSDNVKLPGNSDHTLIVGRNGSGKTQAAVFHLSLRNFDKMPWLVINSKGDATLEKIAKMQGARKIDLSATPKKPGLYFVNPIPEKDDEALNEMLYRIWARGKTGIYSDEGYMLPKGGAVNAIYTQGRSRKLPMITLAQRPAWLTRFAFSESNFIQLFDLTDKEDQKQLYRFMPQGIAVETLPSYHSLWYDVKRKNLTHWGPVPSEADLLETFERRLKPRTTYL